MERTIDLGTVSGCDALQQAIDGACAEGVRLIRLTGSAELKAEGGHSYAIGKTYLKNLITLSRPDVVVDGSAAKLRVEVEDADNDFAVFYITRKADRARLVNLDLEVAYRGGDCMNHIVAVHSNAQYVRMSGCRIAMYAASQVNLTGVYINGNMDTHLQTGGDNFMMNGCEVEVICEPADTERRNTLYGVYCNLVNSVSLTDNFVYVKTVGCGELQKAIGVHLTGRFARLTGNNIKANGSHNVGKLREQAHTVGLYNGGMYTLISNNNIIAEWAGCCQALVNAGRYAKVTGNKILSTHTIKGRSVTLNALGGVLADNIITSTSRNPRLVEINAPYNTVEGNLMEALHNTWEYQSSVGVYCQMALHGIIITGNLIRSACDCGIYAPKLIGAQISNNQICTQEDVTGFVPMALKADDALDAKLGGESIRSIYD